MKLVVIGSGYAGTYLANRLARRCKEADITVINPTPLFVEKARLHQRVARTHGACRPLRETLHPRVQLTSGSVRSAANGEVLLHSGAKTTFDHAVISVGSTVRALPGAIPVGTWDGAQEARRQFAELGPRTTLIVVGGGATGVETAAELAEARKDLKLRLIAPPVAETLSPGARRRLVTGLERLRVDVIHDAVENIDSTSHTVGLASGEEITSDLTIWAIVGGTPTLAADSGLKVDHDGRALVDQTLRSVSDPQVMVVGDCAAVPGARLACQTALPQAHYAADEFLRGARDEPSEPFALKRPGSASAWVGTSPSGS